MITRLKVNGFKNLVDLDISFGPFTCIAGTNAVGKSNLFDAIQFLSDLSDKTLMEAASAVRSEGSRNVDIMSLFHRVGEFQKSEMSFEVDMIIPRNGYDELGQEAQATITSVRYTLILAYHAPDQYNNQNLLEIIKEELVPINQREARRNIMFPASKEWKDSVLKGRRNNAIAFISTEKKENSYIVKLHQDQTSGKSTDRSVRGIPKTILSTVRYANEYPTALLVKNEMKSWQLLQLEPRALRQHDELNSSTHLGPDGSHLPATLYKLKKNSERDNEAQNTYSLLTNKLSELVNDVADIYVDKDDKRDTLTLMVKGKDGTSHSARSLSDGTLRFLGLAVLELDYTANGVICLEEPENGIHPERIYAILKLLQNIATDTDHPVGEDNPIRQVIINTHSPSVVQQVPEDSLLAAELKETVSGGIRFKRVLFSPLSYTWRVLLKDSSHNPISLGKLLAYFSNGDENRGNFDYLDRRRKKAIRVIDREDIKTLGQLPLFE